MEPKFKDQHKKPAPPPMISMRRKNTKSRKLGSIENKIERHNILCIRRATEMNMINGSQK